MQDRTGDTDDAPALEEVEKFEDVVVERPAAPKGARSKKRNQTSPVEPAAVEAEDGGDMEKSAMDQLVPVQDRVLGGLTIRELEMMPKMEEVSQLEEIPVGGTTNIEAEVIGTIAGVAAQSVDGVASLGTTSLRRTIRERLGGAERRARGVEVEVGKREVILDINLRVVYGHSIPHTVVSVRQVVADRLLRLCGLEAKEINVKVTGIGFPARLPGRVE